MNQHVTKGIVLSRTDFGEADRILTILTPDYGKLRLVAKGVRRVKSKLAGGIELFSTSHITFIYGRGELGTLISTRLIVHYGRIIDDIDRVQTGYDFIKMLNKVTEDEPGPEYFELMEQVFMALNDRTIGLPLIRLWFEAQLLDMAGHAPNLKTDTAGKRLVEQADYRFDVEAMTFEPQLHGRYKPDHIKMLRLLFGPYESTALNKITGLSPLIADIKPLIRAMLSTNLNV